MFVIEYRILERKNRNILTVLCHRILMLFQRFFLAAYQYAQNFISLTSTEITIIIIIKLRRKIMNSRKILDKYRINRSQSINTMKNTIAEYNQVSNHQGNPSYSIYQPLRIKLPDFFNIPPFDSQNIFEIHTNQQKQGLKIEQISGSLKNRLKQYAFLAQGMKRAKNIKQQSRFYYIQGVLLSNAKAYKQAIQYFQKFLKIVLFIKDEKSIELALNSIGICFMYRKEFRKAIQYHVKQGNVIKTSDQFITKVNIGMCYELLNQYDNAYRQYQLAKDLVESNNASKKKLIEKLILRAQKNVLNEPLFMTQKKQQDNRHFSTIKNDIKNDDQLIIVKKMEKSSSRKEYDLAKIQLSVHKAQRNIQNIKNSIQRSFSIQKTNKSNDDSF